MTALVSTLSLMSTYGHLEYLSTRTITYLGTPHESRMGPNMSTDNSFHGLLGMVNSPIGGHSIVCDLSALAQCWHARTYLSTELSTTGHQYDCFILLFDLTMPRWPSCKILRMRSIKSFRGTTLSPLSRNVASSLRDNSLRTSQYFCKSSF